MGRLLTIYGRLRLTGIKRETKTRNESNNNSNVKLVVV